MQIYSKFFFITVLAINSFIPLISFEAEPLRTYQKEIFDFRPKDVPLVKTVVDPLTITEFVKNNYRVDDEIKTIIINIGVNDIYRVEMGNKKYILRLSHVDKYLTMSGEEFQFELEWLEFLNQHKIPVSYPIRQINGQLYGVIQALEGPRYATLFSFAEGTTDLNETQAHILGRSLAQLHQVSDTFETSLPREDLNIHQLIDLPVQQIKKFLGKESRKNFIILDKLAEKLKKQISSLDGISDVYGIIAGDVHGGNQHFTEDNHLTLFDFEFCAYGYHIYDIATFKWGQSSDNKELWESFLSGYQSVHPLCERELQVIEAFVMARSLWWMSAISKIPEYRFLLNKAFMDRAFSEMNLYLMECSTDFHRN